MKLNRIVALAIAGVALACAQDGATAQSEAERIAITPAEAQRYAELKQNLILSDAQLQALLDVQKKKNEASQAIYKQLSEKRTALNQLLAGGSTDALRIGTLSIEINTLQKQIPGPAEPWKTSALAVLTPDQRTKLTALSNALQLQRPASQAVSLNLLESIPVQPVPLPRLAIEPESSPAAEP